MENFKIAVMKFTLLMFLLFFSNEGKGIHIKSWKQITTRLSILLWKLFKNRSGRWSVPAAKRI